MRRIAAVLLLTAMLAACEPTAAPEHDALPTLMALPSETPTPDATATEIDVSNLNAEQIAALAQTQTALAATVNAPTAISTATNIPAATDIAAAETATATFTPAVTVTPSLTITNTPTRTPTVTPWPTEEFSPLLELAILALSATPPPYVEAPTATIAPVLPGGTTNGGVLCPPPQGGFSAIYSADAVVAAQIGCSLGGGIAYPVAVQTFERGTMIYVGTSPASIYVLYQGGSYARYDDTWVDGIDPVSGGETPPAGLVEPIRGFGKIWRSDTGVRNGLGWALQPESGATGTVMLFQSGQMIALPTLNQVAVLTSVGTFRLIFGSA